MAVFVLHGLAQFSVPGSEFVPAPFLLCAVAVLIWVTYTDMTVNRVPNHAMILLFTMGLGYLFLQAAWGNLRWWEALLMVLVPGVVAVFMYARQYWGAGDAKLFWMASLLLPLKVDGYAYVIMPSTFLISCYATLFSYLIVWTAVVIVRERRAALKSLLIDFVKRPWSLLLMLGYQFIGVIGLGHLMRTYVGLNLGLLQGVVVVPLVLFLLNWAAGKWWWAAFSPFALYGAYLLVRMPLGSSVAVLGQFGLLVVLMLGRRIGDLVKWGRMKLSRLRPGVILEESVSVHIENGSVIAAISAASRQPSPLPAPVTGPAAALAPAPLDAEALELPPGPIAPDDYAELQELLQQGPLVGNDLVKVRRTLPFAPAVLIGYLLVLYWFI